MDGRNFNKQLVKKITLCAELYRKARKIEKQIEEELSNLGFDIDKLCDGSGNGFEELERGRVPDYTTWSL